MSLDSRSRTFTVTLRRSATSQPWGIRLAGGCDLGTPLIITRAQTGTPCDGVVIKGDIVKKIGDYDSRDIRHQDAQTLFKNAGNTIQLVIQRDNAASLPRSTSSSRCSSVPPLGVGAFGSGGESPHPYPATRLNTALLDHSDKRNLAPSPHRQEIEEEIRHVVDQPYRTTPLVLPGAKVKKDAPPTESYLRHHPNPMMRAPPPPPGLPQEVVMKQKVADTILQRVVGDDPTKKVVHHAFNSPIGLYSEQNIAETIHNTTGATPDSASAIVRPPSRLSYKKTVVYDPAKSETYKALQDAELGDHVQEITVPVQPKVFNPSKASHSKKAPPPLAKSKTATNVHTVPGPQQNVNSLGVPTEEIQQSNTFKRLMYMVLNDY